MKKVVLLIFCALAVTQAFAKRLDDTTVRPAPSTLGSRFFFPNSAGVSIPFRSSYTSLRTGFGINAGVEYRPKYMDAVFYTIDLALLNNNYTSYIHNLPTNIIQGKLSSDFVLTGAGYRKKLNRWAIYGEALPGLGMRSYDRATINPGGVLISRVTNDSFAAKGALGLEYYIKKHFDAFFEPSYYKFFNRQGFNSSRSQLLGFNVGIATARF